MNFFKIPGHEKFVHKSPAKSSWLIHEKKVKLKFETFVVELISLLGSIRNVSS